MKTFPCRWIDDRCQHGYFIDDTEVKFTRVSDGHSGMTGKGKHLCPKGATA